MSLLCLSDVYSNRRYRHRRRVAATSAAVVFSFSILHAQEIPPTEGAREVFLDVGQQLRFSDNPDLEPDDDAEDVLTARTSLQFGYVRRSAVDSFALLLGADLDLRTDGDSDIERPSFGLAWERDVGNTVTGVRLGYTEFDLDSDTISIFDEDTGSIDFGTVDGGKRKTTDLAFEGGFGLERPFGGNYLLSQREIRYSGTDDRDLRDADRTITEGDLFFVISPRITLGLEAGWEDFDERGGGATDTETTFFGTFAETEINSRLTGRFGLGWEEVEDSGARNNTEDGFVFDVDLRQDTPRGENFFEADSSYSSAGQRNELRLGQTIEQSTRQVGYSLGLSDTEGSDIQPIFGLSWVEERPRGDLSVSLEQTAFTDRDANTQVNSLFRIGLTREINTRSSFGVDLSYLDVNELDDGDDSQRLDLSLTYRHELTEDWDLASGVSFVRRDEDGEDDRSANTIFVGLERRFVWR